MKREWLGQEAIRVRCDVDVSADLIPLPQRLDRSRDDLVVVEQQGTLLRQAAVGGDAYQITLHRG